MSSESKNATLTSIATAAGVSVSTASRVLNQNDKIISISQKTKDKVLAAAREMGYMPSMAARALRSGSTRTIGILGTSPRFFIRDDNPTDQHVSFVNEIMRGLINSTVERGYNLTLLTGAELQNVTEMEMLAGFGMVDGMLVLNRDLSAESLLSNTLHRYTRPLVYALDYQDDDETVVAPDDVQGGRLATRTLLERGHKKIAFISAPFFKDIFKRRKAGWEIALSGAGINPAEQFFVKDIFTLSPDKIIASGCTAAVCANAPCAEIFSELCEDAGIAVPGKMEFISFFHETAVRKQNQAFANVVSPLAAIIADGVHQLIDRIEGVQTAGAKKLFPFKMQYGQSCPEK